MDLKCPRCEQVALYSGYPANPNVSTVRCNACGYVGPGYAFHRICSVCECEFDVESVTVEEKDGRLTVTCNRCKQAKEESQRQQ